jgi:hypothetical protein
MNWLFYRNLFLSGFVLAATYPERTADFAAIGMMVALSILLGCGSGLFQLARLFLSPDKQPPNSLAQRS